MTKRKQYKKGLLKNFKFWLLVFGLCLLLLLFLKLTAIPAWFNICIDISSIIGGGMFTSVLVTLFLDRMNEQNIRFKKVHLKHVALSPISTDIYAALRTEIVNFMRLKQSLHAMAEFNKIEKKEFSFLEAVEYLMITAQNLAQYKAQVDPPLRAEAQYQKLLHNLEEFLENKDLYLINEIFTNGEIKYIANLAENIETEIIPSLATDYINIMVDVKEKFFNKLKLFYQNCGVEEKVKRIFITNFYEKKETEKTAD